MFSIKPCRVIVHKLDVKEYQQKNDSFRYEEQPGRRKRRKTDRYLDYMLMTEKNSKSYGKQKSEHLDESAGEDLIIDNSDNDIATRLELRSNNFSSCGKLSKDEKLLEQQDILSNSKLLKQPEILSDSKLLEQSDSDSTPLEQPEIISDSIIVDNEVTPVVNMDQEIQVDIPRNISFITSPIQSPIQPTKTVIFKQINDKVIAVVCKPKQTPSQGESNNIKKESSAMSGTGIPPLASNREQQIVNDVCLNETNCTPLPVSQLSHTDSSTWVSPLSTSQLNVSSQLFADVTDVQTANDFDKTIATSSVKLSPADDLRQNLFPQQDNEREDGEKSVELKSGGSSGEMNKNDDMLFCVAESLLLLQQGDGNQQFCVPCKKNVSGVCPKHGNPMEKLKPTKSVLSLPPTMSIQSSSLPGAGLGVFALTLFEVGSLFGPMEGEKLTADAHRERGNNPYVWEVYEENRTSISYYLDCMDESKSNWMRFVNCARFEEEQNLIAEQYGNLLFYKAYKDVLPGQELLAWYGNAYGRELRDEFECPVETQPIGSDDEYGLDDKEHSAEVQYTQVDVPTKTTFSFAASPKRNGKSSQKTNPKRNGKSPQRKADIPVGRAGVNVVLEDIMSVEDEEEVPPRKLVNKLPNVQPVKAEEFNEDTSSVGVLEKSDDHHIIDVRGSELSQLINRIKNKHVTSSSTTIATSPLNTTGINNENTSFLDLIDMTYVDTGLASPELNHLTREGNNRRYQRSPKKIKNKNAKEEPQENQPEEPKEKPQGPRYVCAKCGTHFLEKFIYDAHVKHSCADKVFVCPHCDKLYKTMDSLRGHMRRGHDPNKKYECSICKKQFTNDGNLRVHLKAHVNTREHQCPHCLKRFNRRVHLKGHILNIHEKLKPYVCSVCDLAFSRVDGLRRHERTHDPEYGNNCETCGAWFASIRKLEIHNREQHSWSKETQGYCHLCGIAYKAINAHNFFVHKESLRIDCHMCKRPIMYKHFQKHIRKQHADLISKCLVCNKLFEQGDLLQHMSDVHTQKLSDGAKL